MDNAQNNKGSIFEKMLEAGNALLDAQIMKAKTSIINSNIEDEFFYSKAVVEDPSYSLHSQGYKDKPYRVQNGHLKQMSYQDTAVAAVIQTRQSQVSAHAQLVKSKKQKGWMIELRDEEAMLEKIKEEIKAEMATAETQELDAKVENEEQNGLSDQNGTEGGESENVDDIPIAKAEGQDSEDEVSLEGTGDDGKENVGKSDDESEEIDFELERKAKERLRKKFQKAKKDAEDYILNCGRTENRPFESKKWNFESALRAMTRDTLTYDLYAVEIVPDRVKRPHHWFPMDGGTVKQASLDLSKYKDMASNFYNIDILYPERNEEAKEKQKIIELDEALLAKDAYRWVQVIKGKIERAYTEDELKVGIRNVNTDIFNNGYGISELELLVSMVTGHLNAEYYNQAYFTQGFSAKGILHIKAAINKRKLETVRTQWQHMVKGARNSFQTPIFAGVEDVNWIPLTQNHNDIGFEGWMRYLITMISAIYQIDPSEMGMNFKAEGSGGSLGNSSDQKHKTEQSKDKGLYPLLRHFENFINENVLKPFDARFVLKFTGLDGEDQKATLERQEKEVKFKKTVNEVRAEDGLPPIPGMDDVILDAQYMAWYNLYSKNALDKQKRDQDQAAKVAKQQLEGQAKNNQIPDEELPPPDDVYNSMPVDPADPEAFGKAVKIEYYRIGK